MVYDRTETPLIWADNGQENKLFAIAFQTLPEDSTGVFHILEHTVLCGSGKYPVREPFVELIKSSVNTFLNAMTYPDKTVYPVSSRNTKDFLNLTSVYLDAVFDPALLHNPNIFRQEGWHLEPEEDGLSYNGVVFNEMKGAMSTADSVMEQAMNEELFPETLYRFNSGGDPAHIPDLTYEQYVSQYHRYYHPTNARIVLDGAVPLDDTLPLIASYLSRFEKGEAYRVPFGKTAAPVRRSVPFAATRPDDPEHDGQVWLGKVFAAYDNKTKIMAAQVLADALTGSNDAPLTRAVLSEELADDVTFSVIDGVLQPWFAVCARSIRPEKADRFAEVVREVAEGLVRDGISRDRLRAAINSLAFRVRELPEPQALMRAFTMLDVWPYGGDPLAALDYDTPIKALREMADSDGFEKLLEELLLQGDLTQIIGVPSTIYEAGNAAAEQQRLEGIWQAVSEEEKDAIRAEFDAFAAWQAKEDTPEQLATLPMLTLADIDPKPIKVPTETTVLSGVTVRTHDLATNGVVYLDMYFPLTDCPLEALPDVVFAASLLGQMDTAAHKAEELDSAIRTVLGGFSADVSVHEPLGTHTECIPMLTVTASMLKENMEEGLALVKEILLTTDFSDTARIRENLMQEEMGARQSMISGGHALAMTVVGAPYAASGAASDAMSGLGYLKRILALAADPDAAMAPLASAAARVKGAFTKARMTLSVTGAPAESVSGFAAGFPEGEAVPATVSYSVSYPARLAIKIPAAVGYAAMGSHLSQVGLPYSGLLQVLARIVSFDYLWSAVRMSGGAYGCGMGVRMGGRMYWYSYRDPSPVQSEKAFAETAEFIRAFAEKDPDLTKYIISTTSSLDPLVGPHTAATIADQEIFAGITYDKRCQTLSEILSADPAKLAACAGYLKEAASGGMQCIVAGADVCETLDGSFEVVTL